MAIMPATNPAQKTGPAKIASQPSADMIPTKIKSVRTACHLGICGVSVGLENSAQSSILCEWGTRKVSMSG